jgi:DNA-binding NtrC family response regulator
MSYQWPGNLRELENVLECAFLFSPGPVIDSIALPQPDLGSQDVGEDGNLRELRRRVTREAESKVMIQALQQYNGNVSAVARSMRITPRAVHMRLKSHGINAATYRLGTRLPDRKTLLGVKAPEGTTADWPPGDVP